MTSFFTIDNVEDADFPPEHSKVLKFFDRASAENFLRMLQGWDLFSNAMVGEHEVGEYYEKFDVPRTTFELQAATHVDGKEMVLAVRYVEGTEVNRGWFERHRLDAESPTGVVCIVELLKRSV